MRRWLCAACAGAVLLTGFFSAAPCAEARIGTEIGVYFPTGGGGSHEGSDDRSYASLTFGKVVEELTVEEKSGRLLMKLRVTNESDDPYTVEHRDGQVYDFVVLDKHGNELYRWSDGMAFTQALTSSTVDAHDSVTYEAEIKRKDFKKIKDDAVLVMAFIKDTDFTLSTDVPDTDGGTSGGAAIHGAIIIGNGASGGYPWW